MIQRPPSQKMRTRIKYRKFEQHNLLSCARFEYDATDCLECNDTAERREPLLSGDCSEADTRPNKT